MASKNINKASKTRLLVAAIDFGTMYSGYAFSFRHEFDEDPTKISAAQWTGEHLSLKTPTCVLVRPDGTFDSFGYEAEDKYYQLAEDKEHTDWYFFKRFKRMLFGKIGLQRDILLEDSSGNGKFMHAKTVFSMAIKYLKDHLLETLDRRTGGVAREDDINWVLTVPAIWNDSAKQFMREAAEEAGIQRDQLSIALEPEAASLYCRHLNVSRMTGPDKVSLASLQPGTQYLVLDCGGGTVDITVHCVGEGGTLKELHRASGGAWGGTRVDDAFQQLLIQIVGAPVFNLFYKNCTDDYIFMFREFESKKRTISSNSVGKLSVRVPASLRHIFETETEENVEEVIEQTPFAGKIKWPADRFRIDASLIKDLFNEAIESIVNHLRDLMESPAVEGTSIILMVGGFSESIMLQDAVKKNFPNMKVIIPEEAGLAIVKGAVIFGHKPCTITERVCKFTYGIKSNVPFLDFEHPTSRLRVHGGQRRCIDIFDEHVHSGQSMKVGEVQREEKYYPAYAGQSSLIIEVYVSLQQSPSFVTDPACIKLGEMDIPIPEGSRDAESGFYVGMNFAGTEFCVQVREEATGKITRATFDFLE